MNQPKKLECLKSLIFNQESDKVVGGGFTKTPGAETGQLVVVILNGQLVSYHRPEIDKITL